LLKTIFLKDAKLIKDCSRLEEYLQRPWEKKLKKVFGKFLVLWLLTDNSKTNVRFLHTLPASHIKNSSKVTCGYIGQELSLVMNLVR